MRRAHWLKLAVIKIQMIDMTKEGGSLMREKRREARTAAETHAY